MLGPVNTGPGQPWRAIRSTDVPNAEETDPTATRAAEYPSEAPQGQAVGGSEATGSISLRKRSLRSSTPTWNR
jgi:hypothetical protein